MLHYYFTFTQQYVELNVTVIVLTRSNTDNTNNTLM